MMKTILITNDPDIAKDAQAAGVTRIMVDLESMGKKERQASRQTFISTHVADDVAKIRAVLMQAELIVRINPIHAGSKKEIDRAVKDGADIIMLPMIKQLSQFEDFLKILDGRAKPLPLVETAYSMAHLSDIVFHHEVDEVYFGLNDLHLSLGLDFLFEPLALGLIDWMAEMAKTCGRSFGFGGMAVIGSGELPAERILGEHVRMGSSCVILSSRFGKDIDITQEKGRRERLTKAVAAIQSEWKRLYERTPQQMQADASETFAIIRTLADKLRSK